ncbi:hypothetical protein RUND412_008215 [Rhizina undulata]
MHSTSDCDPPQFILLIANRQRLGISTLRHITSRAITNLPGFLRLRASDCFLSTIVQMFPPRLSDFNAKMDIDDVPPKILQEIVSYLFGSDLDSLRLVNYKLSAVANIFKFRALKVPVTRTGLDNLLKISRQPELALCVREITYPHDRLAPMEEPELDEGEYDGSDITFVDIKLLTTSFFHWYTYNYDAQIELEVSGEYVRTLESALLGMPNIRVIIPGHNSHDIEIEFTKWKGTLTEGDADFVHMYSKSVDFDIWDVLLDPNETIESEEGAMKSFMDLVKTIHCLGFKPDRFGRGGACVWRGFFSNGSDLWNCASLF